LKSQNKHRQLPKGGENRASFSCFFLEIIVRDGLKPLVLTNELENPPREQQIVTFRNECNNLATFEKVAVNQLARKFIDAGSANLSK
jgi:hypothetical protein